jgi:hypothetical protein
MDKKRNGGFGCQPRRARAQEMIQEMIDDRPMRKKYRINRALLLTASFLILAVQPVLHESQDLDIDLLSPHPLFEKRHPEDLAAGKGDNFQGLMAIFFAFFLLTILMETISSFRLFPEALSILLLNQQTSVLRC